MNRVANAAIAEGVGVIARLISPLGLALQVRLA